MLHHKLLRTEPATLGHMLAIADKYAMADSAIKTPTQLNAAGKIVTNEPARRQPAETGISGSRRDRDRNQDRSKRKDVQPDIRYGSAHIVAIENTEPAAGGSRRMKGPADDRP